MEMAGASFTFLRLDDELAALLDAPAHTPFFRARADGMEDRSHR